MWFCMSCCFGNGCAKCVSWPKMNSTLNKDILTFVHCCTFFLKIGQCNRRLILLVEKWARYQKRVRIVRPQERGNYEDSLENADASRKPFDS